MTRAPPLRRFRAHVTGSGAADKQLKRGDLAGPDQQHEAKRARANQPPQRGGAPVAEKPASGSSPRASQTNIERPTSTTPNTTCGRARRAPSTACGRARRTPSTPCGRARRAPSTSTTCGRQAGSKYYMRASQAHSTASLATRARSARYARGIRCAHGDEAEGDEPADPETRRTRGGHRRSR